MRCLKNNILKTLGYLNFIIFLVSACAVDSETWLPLIVCCFTLGYLGIFAYANDACI